MAMPKTNYSQFETSSLLELLKQKYDLPEKSECILFKNGLNDLYKIISDAHTYFLRISLCGVYTKKQIEEEISFIHHLHNCGIEAVKPMPLRDGSYVWEIKAAEGVRQAVMFCGLEQNPKESGEVRMENLGAYVARMHIASRSFGCKTVRPKIDGEMLAEAPMRLLRRYLRHRPDDLAFLNKTAPILWKKADSMLSVYDDVYGFCHGDVQPANMFFDGVNPILIDFDCMGEGYFAYDLGVLLTNLCLMFGFDADRKSLWEAVIKGYCSVRQMNKDEKNAIHIFAALHMLRVLSYHAKLINQNSGAFYFMTDAYLDTYFTAYRKLVDIPTNIIV